MPETVRTRFAPSPTGYLHVGGARTALFNYLLARRAGGQFLVRIEDTDQTRNLAEADRRLLDDLRWLGLLWDEGPEVGGPYGPYHQSERLDIYRAYAQQLIDNGQAYYAFETREGLEALRRAAQQRGERGFRYPRPKEFPTDAEVRRAREEGRPAVVRFCMPERDFVVHDEVLGDVEVKASELSDFVILKNDGWPTYHFAVVVDDALMRITHVLRGQEHLLNSANHMALQEAFGFPTPAYAHLPIIFTMQGAKMSKREKDRAVRAAAKAAGLVQEQVVALSATRLETVRSWLAEDTQLESEALRKLAAFLHVELPEIDIHDFRVSGYLPEVLVNFIALLGWNPGTERERFTLAELCEAFALERVGRKNARFDREKLLAFNTMALEAAPPERALAAFRDFLSVNPSSPLAGLEDATLARLIEMNRGLRTFRDIERKAGALFIPDEQIAFDEKAVQKWLRKGDPHGAAVLGELRPALAGLADWSPPAIDELIRGYAERHELGLGKVAQPLRIAVTGGTVSPLIGDTLALLGRERTLARIERLLAHLDSA